MKLRKAWTGMISLAAAAVLFPACATNPSARAPAASTPALTGRVTFRGAPVPGASVTLFERYGPNERNPYRTVTSGGDGGFSLTVAPGSYYVEAEGTFEGGKVFSFTGQNPVRLEKGERWLGLKAVPRMSADVSPGPAERGAVVEGTVVTGGVAVENAYVYVYPSPDGQFKGMGIAMSPPTGPDGKFAIENLTESTYYLVARRRGGGEMTGPLGKGDLYGYFPGNPVYLKDRSITRVAIEVVEKEKQLSYSDVTSGTEAALKGRVVDRSGTPQEGVYAFVYDNRVFGHQRPYGHSGRTGRDGAFAIYLDRPGTYYLGARENFGNSPLPGERFGFYDGTPDHSIAVGQGKGVEGIVIVVERILAEKP